MNAYVVLLRKITTIGPQELCPGELLRSFAERDVMSSWVALGHFDTMHVYELQPDSRGLFEAINQNTHRMAAQRDKSGYSHPLYLISDQDDRDFWCDFKPFVAVLRIHFAESVHVHDAFERITADLRENGLAEDGCHWRVYHTIELSDMILAVKGRDLTQIVKMALSLRRCAAVGKVYTYFGINASVVEAPETMCTTEDCDSKRVAWCSVRFSARDFQSARKEAAKVKALLAGTEVYSVAGVDDMLITAPKVSVKDLIRLYQWCFFQSGPLNPVLTTRLGVSLNEVGDALDEVGDAFPPQSVKTLQSICEDLRERSWVIYDRAGKGRGSGNDWVWPLPKLSDILVRMARTPLLDEFIYLMLPGVRAFLANVEAHFNDLSDTDRGMCRVFVENWTDLMEHIMRIEGQLTHHPDLRPILHDIPISMLEYTMAFLRQVMYLLEHGDVQKRGDIAFLLVPRLCSQIQAQELYPAQSNSCPGLVLVTIPFQLLYRPEEVHLALAHEASHFVGEESRCRDLRIDCFAASAAPLVAREIFGTMASVVTGCVRDRIQAFLHKMGKPEWPHTMEDIRLRVNAYLNEIAEEGEEFSKLTQQVLWNAPEDIDVPLDEITPWAAQSLELSNWLDDLSTLYREVYADICMLALLPVDEERYSQSLLSVLPSDGFGYTQMAVRLYVCLLATSHVVPYHFIETQNIAFFQVLKGIRDGIQQEDCFPTASINPLGRYAEECFRRVRQRLQAPKCQEKLQKIQRTFRSMTDREILYTQLIQDVDDYRIQLLSEFSK